MRIVFMGTPELAATVLEGLIESEYEIAGVFTQPDKKKGRGQEVVFSEVKELALKHGLEVFQPTKLKEEWVYGKLEELAADIIVVAAFGQILPENILKLPKYGCINVHTSLLPKYRGASPIQWAVINGDAYSGVTIQYMDKGIDTGDIIASRRVELEKGETGGSLHDKLAVHGKELLLEALESIANGTATRTPQDNESANYVGILDKSMGNIDFSKKAEEIERLIRGLNPWPSAFTYLDGKLLKIWKAEVLPDVNKEQGIAELNEVIPGTILDVTKDKLVIKTGDGILSVLELQIEGKRRMNTADFLRGYEVKAGTVLG